MQNFKKIIYVWRILSQRHRFIVIASTLLQIFLNFLDLFALLIIGVFASLYSETSLETEPSHNSNISRILNNLNPNQELQLVILGVTALTLLITRTLLSAFFTRRILIFFSSRGAETSSKLVAQILSQPLTAIQSKSTQNYLYSVTTGVELLYIQILASGIILISDVTLVMLLTLSLFFIDIEIALASIFIFLSAMFLNWVFIRERTYTLGLAHYTETVKSNNLILDSLHFFRESFVKSTTNSQISEISHSRNILAAITGNLYFIPYLVKYFLEIMTILAALLVGVTQLLSKDLVQSLGALMIFLATASRVTPAILRAQQGLIMIKKALGQSSATLELISTFPQSDFIYASSKSRILDKSHSGFNAKVEFDGVSFFYPEREVKMFENLDLVLLPGTFTTIIGSSGSGKTTFVEVLLGLRETSGGQVSISGLPPRRAFETWPGSVAYVPQQVFIKDGTIGENIQMGSLVDGITEEQIWHALEIANLAEFVHSLPEGIGTHVGEKGAFLSGGQRQRLGIARAMISNPKLLVLDEATSQLDNESEMRIAESIEKLRGIVTVIDITHRLNSIRNADLIVLFSDSHKVTFGDFKTMQDKIPLLFHSI